MRRVRDSVSRRIRAISGGFSGYPRRSREPADRLPAMAAIAADDLGRSSSSRRSWTSTSFREVWNNPEDVFRRGSSDLGAEDEENLKWAALEKLPTYDRMRRGILRQVAEDGRIVEEEVDVTKLGIEDKKLLMESILRLVEEDNERFLHRLRDRVDSLLIFISVFFLGSIWQPAAREYRQTLVNVGVDRPPTVGIEIPKIEVRFEHLSVEADAYVESRALPTLLNATINTLEGILGLVRLSPSKKRANKILRHVTGILRPSRCVLLYLSMDIVKYHLQKREIKKKGVKEDNICWNAKDKMTLLLGPPGSGKTTLLLALAGKLDKQLRVSGKITYCGHDLSEFVPQRTCAYISQHDLHNGEMTVRETLDFSGRCLGVGTRYEMLTELSRREKEAGIKPDSEIDAFMKATAVGGQDTNLVTDYIVKLLGLDICADIMVGNEMRRGISGGQKKRVTTGEMLVGPAKALFMDEISTGLDSSTTFQIVKYMRQMVHVMDGTMLISLLQPAPETFDLFDDVILLSEGQIVYQGPRENILEFFELLGFKCPDRKGVADFLQEVTSKKDQGQYWFDKTKQYRYISVPEFVECFKSFHVGQQLEEELRTPFDRNKTHPAALATEKYGISNWELFRACFAREWLLMKRNSFVLVNVMFNGMAELAMTVLRLPVFYKQRDFLFYPPWAFGLPIWVLRIPLSLLESGIWVTLTYYVIGFAPPASRFFRQFLAFFCTHQMALSLFRFIAAAGRTVVVANTFGTFALLPNMDTRIDAPTIGKALLKSRSLFTDQNWYWTSIGALLGFSLIFNVCFILALTYLNRKQSLPFNWVFVWNLRKILTASCTVISAFGNSQSAILDEDTEQQKRKENPYADGNWRSKVMGSSSSSTVSTFEGIDMAVRNGSVSNKGMVLPFQPVSLAFNHVNYYVDMPAEMKRQGIEDTRLQLLRDVSGAFRPGVLTALVGVSGAGKTTLMDVLAGRKTGGYIEGSISISGYPKNQATFARVSGYCEQNDIHSPHVTIYESIVYSAWLRLSPDVKPGTRKMFVEEVMELVELSRLKNALVGLPGINGLSTEQRKRLTIAVELVANPSIIFMDEPTSGLDARAAAIVMRTVRNTVDTGRTVVCTIHQPSIDIFEAFDELLLMNTNLFHYQLLLMKRGGQVIYAGFLGRHSQKLIEYFEAIPGIPKIRDGYNPATWMLEVSSTAVESHLDLDFADVYANSGLYKTFTSPPYMLEAFLPNVWHAFGSNTGPIGGIHHIMPLDSS
ncbi:Pleiotropic drug resistance protein 2 [Asimina triloba]